MRKAVADKRDYLDRFLALSVGDNISLTYPNPDAAHSARNTFYRIFGICVWDEECIRYKRLDKDIKISKTKAEPCTLNISRRRTTEIVERMTKDLGRMVEILTDDNFIDAVIEGEKECDIPVVLSDSITEEEIGIYCANRLAAFFWENHSKGLILDGYYDGLIVEYKGRGVDSDGVEYVSITFEPRIVD